MLLKPFEMGSVWGSILESERWAVLRRPLAANPPSIDGFGEKFWYPLL
jgi:hypothetical protein